MSIQDNGINSYRSVKIDKSHLWPDSNGIRRHSRLSNPGTGFHTSLSSHKWRNWGDRNCSSRHTFPTNFYSPLPPGCTFPLHWKTCGIQIWQSLLKYRPYSLLFPNEKIKIIPLNLGLIFTKEVKNSKWLFFYRNACQLCETYVTTWSLIHLNNENVKEKTRRHKCKKRNSGTVVSSGNSHYVYISDIPSISFKLFKPSNVKLVLLTKLLSQLKNWHYKKSYTGKNCQRNT